MSSPEIRHVQEQRVPRNDDRSLGELFGDLSRETSALVRQEVELAKTEMSQKVATVGKDVGFLAAGGAVAYAGLLALVAAVILALGQLGVTWWLSAAIVGAVVALMGAGLVRSGLNNLKNTSLAPTETLSTLKEDTQWVKDQTK